MTTIKVCGLTRVEDARLAVEAGADYLGLIFVPNTPRWVSLAQAKAICEAVQGEAQVVGVFQNATLATVEETVAMVGLDLVQFHGAESVEMTLASPVPVVQVVTVGPGQLVLPEELEARRPNLHAVLLDLPKGEANIQWDWAWVPHPWPVEVPLWLAGKLLPHTVGEALAQCHPAGVDVASGVEAAPGVKDPEKLLAFCRAVRHHDEQSP